MAILKILSRHNPSYKSLIEYILQDGKTAKPEIFTHNLRSDTVAGYTKEFIENESFRQHSRSDQVYLFHEILSFNASEDASKITSEVMQDITGEYIRLRGHEGVMLGAVHRDKEHVHVHMCVSALKFRTGTSFRLSKNELRELKVSLQAYHKQKYPEISKSFPNHGNGKAYVRNSQWHAVQREQRNLLKGHINDKVRSCFEKAASQKEFLELLSEENLHHYERGGKPYGIEYEDTKFRFSGLLEPEQLEALPVDVSEEEKALGEISSIREEREDKEREDIEREDEPEYYRDDEY
ncbi:MAG TPA: relaxase/mobilization nuclease domain-containing protein [Mucilaginibacter sp.]|nr:relaxase/mobilization nuclease domain-containing protein [Mucilaginibacter sp.]